MKKNAIVHGMEVNSMYIPLPRVKGNFKKTRSSASMYPASRVRAMMKSALQVPYQGSGVHHAMTPGGVS